MSDRMIVIRHPDGRDSLAVRPRDFHAYYEPKGFTAVRYDDAEGRPYEATPAERTLGLEARAAAEVEAAEAANREVDAAQAAAEEAVSSARLAADRVKEAQQRTRELVRGAERTAREAGKARAEAEKAGEPVPDADAPALVIEVPSPAESGPTETAEAPKGEG